MKTVAVDSESIVPAFASGIFSDATLMRLVFEQIVKPNEMDGMCCTKMHFQYVNNYGNKLAQIDPIDMVGRKPMELVGFKKCLKRIKAWHSFVDFYQHSTEIVNLTHQNIKVEWFFSSPKG